MITLYVQIPKLEMDAQLEGDHMANDVKLVFRSGQAAGVSHAALQRAAARFKCIMQERLLNR